MKGASLRSVLARRLREVAAERGVALTHVADRAGVGRSHLWRLLNAEAGATIDAVEKIAEALDVDPVALLTPASAAPSIAPMAAEPAKKKAKRATHPPSAGTRAPGASARGPSKHRRRASRK